DSDHTIYRGALVYQDHRSRCSRVPLLDSCVGIDGFSSRGINLGLHISNDNEGTYDVLKSSSRQVVVESRQKFTLWNSAVALDELSDLFHFLTIWILPKISEGLGHLLFNGLQ